MPLDQNNILSLVFILLYALLNSSNKAANILIFYRTLSRSCLDSSSSWLLLKSTLTKGQCPCGLEAKGKTRVPFREAKGKKKHFLNIGKRSQFRKSHETQNLARQGTVCAVHLKRLDTWPQSFQRFLNTKHGLEVWRSRI